MIGGLSSLVQGSGFFSTFFQVPSSANLRAKTTANSVLTALDGDSARQQRYQRLWAYYFSNQYSEAQIEGRVRERARMPGGRSDTSALDTLYAHISSFFNIVPESVDLDVGAVFREPTQFDASVDSQQAGLNTILRRSRMAERRREIVRFGATTGDVVVRVLDDWDEKTVKIVVYPSDICRVVTNPFDRDVIDFLMVSYDYVDRWGGVSQQHNRTDIIYPNTIETYRDGQPFDFDGSSVDGVQDNRLGFVPARQIQNTSTGDDFGVPTFHSILPTLDKVNEVMSFLFNIIAMNADPPLVAYGLPPNSLQKGSDATKYNSTVWYIPNAGEKSRIELLEWKGNIPDVYNFITGIKSDIRDAMPETHVNKMQQQGAYSGEALNAMMFAFISKIEDMRISYVAGVQDICSMALGIQAMMSDGMAEYDPMDERFDVTLGLPPVLPVDENALLNRVVAKLKAGLISKQQALEELSYPTSEIDRILADAEKEAQAAQQAQMDMAAASAQATKGTNNQPVNNQLNSGNGKGA